MNKVTRQDLIRFVRRSVAGYFTPVIALCQLRKKRSWNVVRQMRVICRYTFGR